MSFRTVGFVSTWFSKSQIETTLEEHPTIKITGSQMTEDGWDLFLEGEAEEMEEFISILEANSEQESVCETGP